MADLRQRLAEAIDPLAFEPTDPPGLARFRDGRREAALEAADRVIDTVMKGLLDAHHKRVTELLEANNREVEQLQKSLDEMALRYAEEKQRADACASVCRW